MVDGVKSAFARSWNSAILGVFDSGTKYGLVRQFLSVNIEIINQKTYSKFFLAQFLQSTSTFSKKRILVTKTSRTLTRWLGNNI